MHRRRDIWFICESINVMKRRNFAIAFLLLIAILLPNLGGFTAQGDELKHVDAEEDYVLVFSDEFNQPDGSHPDERFWSCSRRGGSTWNRWISKSPDVAIIRNGKLVCRAIRNRSLPTDTASWLTGAIETQGKFSFQYGKIEVRVKTNLHSGNFPAVWLIPEPPADPHPLGGEIDIFESFGPNKNAEQTVHTHWTVDLKHHDKPNNKFVKKDFNIRRWHVYGLVWTPERLVFTIDGKVSGVYDKSNNKVVLANKQWPFDHPFYIILNQSLRPYGTDWGGNPDPNYIYETQFDWVRVYQKKGIK